MNKENLKDKWWYRLVQVIFGLVFVVIAVIGIFAAWEEKPYKVFDYEKSYIQCSNIDFKIAIKDNDIGILGGQVAYSDERRVKLSCGTDEQRGSLKDLSANMFNLTVSSWPTNYGVVSFYKWQEGDWSEYLHNLTIGVAIFLFMGWIVRRIFFYVTIKEKFNKF